MDQPTLPALMARAEFLDYAHLAPKLLALNAWLHDGQLASGGTPAYQAHRETMVTSGQFFQAAALNAGAGAPPKTTIHELARSAVSLVNDQIFADGNTRMAVLIILEYLASVGVLYSRNPVRIYWQIAVRNPDPSRASTAIAAVEKEVGDSNYKPNGGVTAAQREIYAKQVKEAPLVWDAITKIRADAVAAPSKEEKEAVLRTAKQANRYVYDLYVERYGSS